MSNKKSFSLNLSGLIISNEKLEIGNLSINIDSDSDLPDQVTHNHIDRRVVHQHTAESEAAAAAGRVEEKKLDLETISKVIPLALTGLQAVLKASHDAAQQRHNLRMQEMAEEARLEAEKHRRIQESKGGKPMTPEQVMEAIKESNKQLLDKLTTSVRLTRTP